MQSDVTERPYLVILREEQNSVVLATPELKIKRGKEEAVSGWEERTS